MRSDGSVSSRFIMRLQSGQLMCPQSHCTVELSGALTRLIPKHKNLKFKVGSGTGLRRPTTGILVRLCGDPRAKECMLGIVGVTSMNGDQTSTMQIMLLTLGAPESPMTATVISH